MFKETTFAFLAMLLLAYRLHIPLPADFTERGKMQAVEFILRLTYFYPMRLLAPLGTYAQLQYTRSVLSGLGRLVADWTDFSWDLHISDVYLDGIPTRVFRPAATSNGGGDITETPGAILFFHGGGFVLSSVGDYDSITRDIARRTGLTVFSVEYRLAPEHVYPAGLEDGERAVTYMLREGAQLYGVDPSKLVLIGDSAGGNMVAVLSRRLRDHRTAGDLLHLPEIKMQVLIYPLLQYLDFLTPSYQQYYTHYHGTAFLDPESIARWILMYFGVDVDHNQWLVPEVLSNSHHLIEVQMLEEFEYRDHYRLPDRFLKNASRYEVPTPGAFSKEAYELLSPFLMDPEFSPLFERNLTGMPSTVVLTCEYDILRDEGVLYAGRLKEAGVKADWRHYDQGFHAMLNFHTQLELAQRMLQDIADSVRNAMDS